MKTWKRALKDSLIVGSFASLTSLAGLALRGRAENGSPWGPVNAPGHWVWGDRALLQDRRSLRYTAAGLLVHHLSAGFWGLLHEKVLGTEGQAKAVSGLLRDAAATTAVAALVDLRLVPHRLTPGFQLRLSPFSLVVVYALFGLGLAAGSYLAGRRERPETGL